MVISVKIQIIAAKFGDLRFTDIKQAISNAVSVAYVLLALNKS